MDDFLVIIIYLFADSGDDGRVRLDSGVIKFDVPGFQKRAPGSGWGNFGGASMHRNVIFCF